MTDMTCDLHGVLDAFCPMHMMLDASGKILATGATLAKLRPDLTLAGRPFSEVMTLTRPVVGADPTTLARMAGQKIELRFRDPPHTALKGVVGPSRDGTIVLNLSFGISVLDAVRDYDLTGADFAATDLAIEMLYLVEAKSAAMEASRTLNLRLQGAKIAAEEQAFAGTRAGLTNGRARDPIRGRRFATDLPFALVHLDLDYVKAVNDTMGHAAGDHVLQEVARIMVDETRQEDTAARVGGDEFVLLFQNMTEPARLVTVADRMIRRMEEPIPFGSQICRISCSAGIAVRDDQTEDPAALMHQADLALYAAKRAGRACARVYRAEDGYDMSDVVAMDAAHQDPPRMAGE